MKNLFLLSTIVILLISCGKAGERADHGMDEDQKDDPNRALYDQVIQVHNEAMEKMDSLYSMKQKLTDQITNTAGMGEDKKKELLENIAQLDSASDAMMSWMHKFNPLPDSADTEDAREYLETEMERIKKVRDQMNETLERAKAVNGKN